MLIAVVTHS